MYAPAGIVIVVGSATATPFNVADTVNVSVNGIGVGDGVGEGEGVGVGNPGGYWLVEGTEKAVTAAAIPTDAINATARSINIVFCLTDKFAKGFFIHKSPLSDVFFFEN